MISYGQEMPADGLLVQFQEYLSDKADLSDAERAELPWRRVAFLAYAFVIFFLGVPLWWMTTTPHRAPLPYLGAEYAEHLEHIRIKLSHSQPSSQIGDPGSADVWDGLHAHSDYSVHFIFVHDNGDNQEGEIGQCHKVQRKLELFIHKYLEPVGVKVAFSAEHLWDFSLPDFLRSQKAFSGQMAIDSADHQLPASLASELDRMISSAPVSTEPLLKLAVFFDTNGADIQFMHNGASVDGLAIASWGGLFIKSATLQSEITLLNAIIRVLYLQFSIKPVSGGTMDPQQTLLEILRQHQKRLVVENLRQTMLALNSLYELAESIADLVISDEVAQLAARSKLLFLRAYNELNKHNRTDSESAAEARRLAERANTDPSLLELLNFPSDQKYGIYVPLFFPLLVPMLQPIQLFVMFMLAKLKKKKREKEENGVSEDKKDEKRKYEEDEKKTEDERRKRDEGRIEDADEKKEEDESMDVGRKKEEEDMSEDEDEMKSEDVRGKKEAEEYGEKKEEDEMEER